MPWTVYRKQIFRYTLLNFKFIKTYSFPKISPEQTKVIALKAEEGLKVLR